MINNLDESNLPAELHRWIAPPAGKNRCPFTGLSHSGFFRTVLGNPLIRQTNVGVGDKRKKRLAWLPDVHSFLMRNAEGTLNQHREGGSAV